MSQNKQSTKSHQEHTTQHGGDHGRVLQVQEREHHDREQLGQEKNQIGQISPNEKHGQPSTHHARPEKDGIAIYIDGTPYHVADDKFTGADLRKLANPPIGADRNIFRVVSGKGDDIKIGDEDVITVNMRESTQGRHFVSVPTVPSKDEVAKRAYFIYLEQGSQPGHDAENWAKAEAQIASHSKN